MPDDPQRHRPTFSEALLTSILDAALDAVITIDAEGAVHTWSVQAERMFGWAASEVVGRILATTIIPERYRQQHERGLARMRAGGKPAILNRRIEITALHRDGHELPVELTVTRVPLRDTWLFSAFVRDLTKQKRSDEEHRRTAEFLSAAQAVANVGSAHDFNNLLSVILGGCDLLLMDEVSDLKRHDLQEIRKAATRAASLTGQLLAASRQQVLAPQIVDLNVLVAKVESLLRRLLGEDIELLRVAAAEPCSIAADPSQLEQVILTLVVNARDAMPNGGKLTIETANVELDAAFAQAHPPIEPGFYVMIAVRDTGTGMDENTRAHLFEPFFTTKQRGKGSGLGLSAVYGIVRQSGGAIDASNEPEGGAAIRIYLPWS